MSDNRHVFMFLSAAPLPPPSLPVSPERRATQPTGCCPSDRCLEEHQWTGTRRRWRRFQPSQHLAAHHTGLFQPRKDRRRAVKPSKHLQNPPGRQPGEAADRASRLLPDNSSQRQMRSSMEMRQEGAERPDRWGGGVNE